MSWSCPNCGPTAAHTSTMVNSRRGRPVGPSDTRRRLIEAGRAQFLAQGYDATTVRAIAEEAGVDHAMVNYWFDGKEGLLRAVLDMIATPGEIVEHVLAGRPEDLATALLTAAVGLWDRPEVAETFRSMVMSAATGGPAERVVREYLGHQLIGRLEEIIGGRDARQRTAAVAALMAGLFMTRYILRLEPIVNLSRREVVSAMAPSLRAALGSSARRPSARRP